LVDQARLKLGRRPGGCAASSRITCDIARRLSIPATTARRIVNTLIRLGILFFPAGRPAYIIGRPFQGGRRSVRLQPTQQPRGPIRNDVGERMLRLTPPTITTFIISVILAGVAVAGQYVPSISNALPINLFWLAVIAYIVLFFGNIIRGI
jgi:hypothetical protein